MDQEKFIALLKAEVLPTIGCTEPGAVALAVAQACDIISDKISRICVIVNPNVYKNGLAVGIPGTGQTGLEIAAALGAVKRQPERQLAVLSDVTPEELAQANRMLASGNIRIAVDESKTDLWIQARAEAGSEWSEVVIKDSHVNVVSIEKNGQLIFAQKSKVEYADYRKIMREDAVNVATLVQLIETIASSKFKFLLDGVSMNVRAAQVGLEKRLGMGIGAIYKDMVDSGVMSDDIINMAKVLTAAAADARMSGENIQIMSSAGSGNHGLTVILPVYAVAQKIRATEEQLVRAIALSHLITIYIKIHTGNLSALCGCAVAAATGATAAITWLMGGTISTIEAAIKNIIANLTGMICDGGKVGCALKLSTAAAVAVESSLLAQRNIVVPDSNGIIADTVEQTIKNLGKVSNPGMLATDKVILDVMLAKGGQRTVA